MRLGAGPRKLILPLILVLAGCTESASPPVEETAPDPVVHESEEPAGEEEESGPASIARAFLLADEVEIASFLADPWTVGATEALAAVVGATPDVAAVVITGAMRELEHPDESFRLAWEPWATACAELEAVDEDAAAHFLSDQMPRGELLSGARTRLEGAQLIRGRCDTPRRSDRAVAVAIREGRVLAARWDDD